VPHHLHAHPPPFALRVLPPTCAHGRRRADLRHREGLHPQQQRRPPVPSPRICTSAPFIFPIPAPQHPHCPLRSAIAPLLIYGSGEGVAVPEAKEGQRKWSQAGGHSGRRSGGHTASGFERGQAMRRRTHVCGSAPDGGGSCAAARRRGSKAARLLESRNDVRTRVGLTSRRCRGYVCTWRARVYVRACVVVGAGGVSVEGGGGGSQGRAGGAAAGHDSYQGGPRPL
jgi:hypothetical protein